MKFPFGWKLPLVAAIAIGIAFWAGANYVISIPAAAVAVAASVLLLVEAWGIPPPRPPVSRTVAVNPRALARDAFRAGRIGREMIVEMLDRLEHSGPNPLLSGTTAAEFDRISHLPREEFREYVRTRLTDLEAHT
jgi:hypothetical protein